MFDERFDQSAALSGASCPRCRSVGLKQIDSDAYSDTPIKNVHRGGATVSPGLYARCVACGLVMDWPGCYSEHQSTTREAAHAPSAVGAKDLGAIEPHPEVVEIAEAGWWGVGGRISRGTFFVRLLGYIALSVAWVGMCIPFKSGSAAIVGVGLLKIMYVFQAIKRARDFGVGAWSGILAAIPLVDLAWLVLLLCVPGTRAANRYGPRTTAPDRLVPAESTSMDRERDRARLVAMMNRDTAGT